MYDLVDVKHVHICCNTPLTKYTLEIVCIPQHLNGLTGYTVVLNLCKGF